jgi:hypothetical protein
MLQTGATTESVGDSLMELLMSPTMEEVREHLLCLRNIAEKGSVVDRLATAAKAANVFRRDGDYWTIAYRGSTSRLRDCLGLRAVAHLLANPGRSIPAVEVASATRGADAPTPCECRDPLLDSRARTEYRQRLVELTAELEAATAANDLGRREALRREIEIVGEELSAAVGLGGRGRRFSSANERARINVTRVIHGALEKLAIADPGLGQHLSRAIHTGGLCSYDPDPTARPEWDVTG